MNIVERVLLFYFVEIWGAKMHKSNRLIFANIVQFFLDILFLFIAYVIAYCIARELTNLRAITEYMWIIIVFIPLWVSIMHFRGMYDKTTFYYLDRVFNNIFFATFFSGMILTAMFFFIKEGNTSRIFIGSFLVLCISVMFIERYLTSRYLIPMQPDKDRIILVCSPETYELFNRYINKTYMRYDIIGLIQVDENAVPAKVKSLGILSMDTFEDILKNHIVDQVVFALPKDSPLNIQEYVNICMRMGITAQNVLNISLGLGKIHSSMLGPMPVLTYHTVSLNPVSKAVKRTMDIAGAVVGIFITLVVGVIIVPLIKLDSPGPIVFKQKRVGRHGRVFDCYKFRTMCADAEEKKKDLQDQNEYQNGLFFKIKEDPRITRIGSFLRRTSLDELPQFFNVLKGEMSLVGTRPPTLEEVAQYDLEHWRRISIKPGITGNWQINGRSNITDFEEVVALDTQYIDKWSIWLDIYILLVTVLIVFRGESAY